MDWQQLISNRRLGQEHRHLERHDDRTEFKRDYDRLIFSAPFRRLQNKTQVFPLPGSIFVHNRLTHSLEVASVGMSLGNDIARHLCTKNPGFISTLIPETGQIVATACLAHALGNPPFGHSGEKAIQTFFSEGRGLYLKEQVSAGFWNDITRFDGNANAFRLLTHQFKGRRAGGFVLTYSTLASIVKYPFPAIEATKQKFGFFTQEQPLYEKIAAELGITRSAKGWHRHPLAYLVEAADDICYEIMDIEDAHKLKILSTAETRDLMLGFVSPDRREHIIQRAHQVDDLNEQVVYFRSCAIGALERECVRVFVENEQSILDGTFEGSLIDHACPLVHDAYSDCVRVAKSRIYRSRDVVDTELAGYKIIYTLMGLFIHAVMNPQHAYSRLLLDRVSSQYEVDSHDTYVRIMAVLDYLSGMTDVFALDLYRKINGESLPMI